MAVVYYGDSRRCKGCFACCEQMTWPPYNQGGRRERIPRAPQATIDRAVAAGRNEDHNECLFLGADGECIHYADRPAVCREFEVGSGECRANRADFLRDIARETRFAGRNALTQLGVGLWNGSGRDGQHGERQGDDTEVGIR